jgi:hypothetical protein
MSTEHARPKIVMSRASFELIVTTVSIRIREWELANIIFQYKYRRNGSVKTLMPE